MCWFRSYGYDPKAEAEKIRDHQVKNIANIKYHECDDSDDKNNDEIKKEDKENNN